MRPRIPFDRTPGPARHAPGALRLVEERRDRLGQSHRVGGRDEQASLTVANQVGDVAGCGRHDRQAGRERFEDRNGLIVDDGGIDEDVDRLQQIRHG